MTPGGEGEALRQSPLRAEHESLGARLVAFGGFEMPLAYPSGTLAEHLACRQGAVAFDVSHLGTVALAGPGAKAALQEAFTNDLDRVGPGRAQYTHLLDGGDGSVVDDCIVWWLGPERFQVMPNASNTAAVRLAVGGRDVTEERAVIAVQGPQARELLAAVAPEAAAVGHFAVGEWRYRGASCLAAGTGYTGEDGVECALPAEVAPRFWRALLAAGVLPAGLGARDTLRLEAGLPLHGHELGPGVTPLQAGLGWVVAFDKPSFLGRDALLAERAAGVRRRLRGLLCATRRPPRHGDGLLVAGSPAGEVTSGNYSPVLGRGIALGFLPPATVEGAAVTIAGRAGPLEATVVRPPFQRLAVG